MKGKKRAKQEAMLKNITELEALACFSHLSNRKESIVEPATNR
jgi:hypothetical protein